MLEVVVRWLRGLCAGLLALLVLVAGFELFAWVLFSKSFASLEEIQGLLMIWFGLLAAAYCLAEGLHLAVDLLVRRLPERWRPALDRLPGLVVAVFGLATGFYGARLVAATTNTLPGTGWSAALQYQPAIVAGLLFLALGLALAVRPELRDRRGSTS